MASNIIFCTGGNRSGKSAFALGLANRLKGSKLFVATAEACDPEMRQRIKKHQMERGPEWQCLEVPISKSCHIAELLPLTLLSSSINEAHGGKVRAILIDCLSTWVSACQEGWNGAPTELEGGILGAFDDLMAALEKIDVPVFIVSAETGMGIISSSQEARQFCDLLGTVNQRAAGCASEVYFCVSGQSLKIK